MLEMRADRELHNGYGRVLFAVRKAKVVSREYKILHGFPDYNRPLQREANANDLLQMPSSFHNNKSEQLQQFVPRILQKECAASTAAGNRTLNPISNKGYKCIDKQDHEKERSRYASTPNLVTNYLDLKDHVCRAKRHATLDFRLGWLLL